MVELIAKSAAAGLLPFQKNDVDLSEIALGAVTSLAPFAGQEKALEQALGTKLPKVGRSVGKVEHELVWFSQGQYLAIGFDVPKAAQACAALTDQSDAWCALQFKGAGASDVLARLVPVDLRGQTFKRGHALRSQLGHMPLHITRLGGDAFRLMSFRSMAGTMVHEITRASALYFARG